MAAATDASLTINDNVGPLSSLVTFDIRNGPLSSAKSLLVKPTIGAAWHWRPVEGLPPHLAVKHVSAYIRTYAAAVAELAAGEYTDQNKRKIAIVLGTARAVCTELYNLEAPDFIPGETKPPMLCAVMAANNEIKFVPHADTTQAQRDILGAALELTEQERAAISSIHMSAIGLLPVQGYSLIMTNHHFLSEKGTQSFKAFHVIERQFWSSTSVKAWWDDSVDILRDALFHKVGHPVLINIKQSLAMNQEVAEKLKTAGCGSAAARLPAVESEVRTANSYRTLLQTVRTLFETYGGYLNFVALDHAIETVGRFPPGLAVQVTPEELPVTVPAWVTNRGAAINYLRQVVEGHTDTVAYCYGFYVALSDAAQMTSGEATQDTLKTSFSLSKLPKQSAASYVAGREAYGDYAAHKRMMRQEGKYNPPTFVFVGARPLPEGTVPTGVGVHGVAPVYAER